MIKKASKAPHTQRKAVKKSKAPTKLGFIDKLRARNPLWKLTPRQLLYRQYRLEDAMSQEAAALKAGYSAKVARKMAYKVDRLVKLGIAQELERVGANDRWQARTLFDIANNGTKMQSCTVEVRMEGDEMVVHDQSRVEVPDLHLRKDTVELIAKLKKQLSSRDPLPGLEDGTKMTIIVEKDPDAPRGHVQPNDKAKPGVQVTHK